MISRFPGLSPTRSRAVVHDNLVFTVAVAPDPVTPSMYEQSVKALARIDESLALCGSHKSKILSAIVYIADMKRKSEMNRAWDEWVDKENPPMRACIGVELEAPHIVEILVTAAK
jgi:enamine deaminase RidA (YjgF/YER057c/UK114 family)